jgi:hypothetical protein
VWKSGSGKFNLGWWKSDFVRVLGTLDVFVVVKGGEIVVERVVDVVFSHPLFLVLKNTPSF